MEVGRIAVAGSGATCMGSVRLGRTDGGADGCIGRRIGVPGASPEVGSVSVAARWQAAASRSLVPLRMQRTVRSRGGFGASAGVSFGSTALRRGVRLCASGRRESRLVRDIRFLGCGFGASGGGSGASVGGSAEIDSSSFGGSSTGGSGSGSGSSVGGGSVIGGSSARRFLNRRRRCAGACIR